MDEYRFVNLDPERLRHITRLFCGLQFGGLTLVAFGTCFFAVEMIAFFSSPLIRALLVLFAFVTWLAGQRYVPKYYERRFGQVESPEMSLPGFVILMLGLVVLMFAESVFGIRIDGFLNSLNNQLHTVISDPEHRVKVGPTLFWAFLLISDLMGFGWGARRRGNPWLWIEIVALPFWSCVFFLPLHHPAVMQSLVWRIVTTAWLGISFMVIGLYEHLTFVSVLPKKTQENNDT